jgi:hypothetical protein
MSNLSLLARGSFAAFIVGAALSTNAQTQAPQTPTTEPASPAAAGGAATIDAAFKQADVNADGKLSSDELSQFPSLAQRFADLDKDKDGAVSSAEFSAGVTVKSN